MLRALTVSLFIAVLASSLPARAASNELDLTRLVVKNDSGVLVADNRNFRALVRELGVVMTPTSLQRMLRNPQPLSQLRRAHRRRSWCGVLCARPGAW